VPRSLANPAELDIRPEDLLAAVLETAKQPIWVVDPEDVIRFVNPPHVAALGYDRADELLGCRGHETVHYRHPDGTAYPAGECPMLLGLAPLFNRRHRPTIRPALTGLCAGRAERAGVAARSSEKGASRCDVADARLTLV
jgi:PAS domain-containing protein